MIKESVNKQRKAHQVLIENKLSFAGEGSELSIYDTFENAADIKLISDQLMFCGMVSGKKIMHADQGNFTTDFLPHESFVMAPNRPVKIDFPSATIDLPTTCIAIEISNDRVKQVSNALNSAAPLTAYNQEWQYNENLLHTHHNSQTQALLDRMVHIFTENDQDKSFLIDLAVNELTARLLRHQTRDFILANSAIDPTRNALNNVIHYLQTHIKDEINIDSLCKISCMSRTKFFNEFKKVLGVTPQDFLFQLRLVKAAELLKNNCTVTQACFASGYLNVSHFSRSFKRFYGLSPNQYKLKIQ